MYLQIKTRNSYSIKVDAIKKKLNSYSNKSFLRVLYSHFQSMRKPENGLVSNLPWCCFLALKWKYTESVNIHAKKITHQQFDSIINRIYELQSDATDLQNIKGIELELRRMVIGQMLYQTSFQSHMHSLARQYLWYCQCDCNWYRKTFFAQTGIKLDAYYIISFYLLTIILKLNTTESVCLHIKDVIIPLYPYLGEKTLKNYISLMSLQESDLAGFFTQHSNGQQHASEYFEDTPLLRKPFIMGVDCLIILSKNLLLSAFSSAVPRVLKEKFPEKYKDRFGPLVELYLESYIRQAFSELITEADIISLYKGNHTEGPKVDYLLREGDSYVFIDSKAIEPHKDVKTSVSPVHLKGKLKSSFEHGIIQAQGCCHIINTIKKRATSDKDSIIIVVHQDHFISTGSFLDDNISPTLFSEIKEKYGYLPVFRERIYYLTIDELEYLIDVCREKKLKITDIIDKSASDDASPKTRKMNFGMHLASYSAVNFADRQPVRDSASALIRRMAEAVNCSQGFWNGKVDHYLKILHSLTSR